MSLIKKNKLKVIFKLFVFSILTASMIIIINVTNNIYSNKKTNKIIEEMNLLIQIYYPNSYIGQTEIYNLGFYNYIYNCLFYKNIDGNLIRSLEINKSGGLFGTNYNVFNDNSMSKSISDLNDINWNNRKITNNGLKELLFIHPNAKFNNIIDDKNILEEINSDKLIEVAVSFDKSYSISDINNILNNDLVTFYWVNVNPVSNNILDNIYMENDVIGIKLRDSNNKKIKDYSRKFINALENLKSSEFNYLPYDNIYSDISGNNNILEEDDILINGAVLVGTKSAIIENIPTDIINYIFIGNIVDKY